MGKANGLGMALYVGGYDLSGDVGQIDAMGNTPANLQMTGLDKSGLERVRGREDGKIQFTGFFNDAALQEHAALKLVPTADVYALAVLTGFIGTVAGALRGKRGTYAFTNPADGRLTWQTDMEASEGAKVQWGQMLTAGKKTDTSAANGTGVDFLAGSTSFGLVAHLHVFSVVGTSVTVTIQESSDNGSGDAFAAVTGGAFSAVTPAAAPTAQRIETSLTQTVERYLRAVTTGTFSSAQFAVMAKRYASAGGEA